MTQELSSELDLTRIIRPHDNVVWAQGSGEPVTLVERLVEQRHKIGGIRAFIGGMALSGSLKPEHTDRITISALGAVGTLRSLSRAGALHILPIHLSQLPGYLLNGAIGSEVVFLHLSAPDEHGRYSYSLANDYLQFAMKRARVVIAEVNDQAPWTYFGGALEPSRIDYTVRVSRPVMQIVPSPFGQIERQIAKHVSDYVDDGATIQIGIGAIPDAVLAGLADHRDLGFHSGLLTDRVLDLIKRGVITNARKPIDTGTSICVTLLGTKRLYKFAHKNPAIKLHTLMHTHRPEILSRLDHFVAINSAVEADLTGQINAEVAGGVYIGAVGGQCDFGRGALMAAHGRSIIAFPATARGDTISRVVARLSGPVTTTRSDADLIITEFGAADLRGRTVEERVKRMLAISHPNFREQLESEARALPKD